ncbi:hypothetical protein [Bacillus sp. JCM 19034]|uniref:hypothetical protein n=1 Tax=Bacillus sp. JCM 19034 TaxID=1481928 RepID=UPI000782F993|nr:hypothetical protein [Bacillus sp. JCM 19034]
MHEFIVWTIKARPIVDTAIKKYISAVLYKVSNNGRGATLFAIIIVIFAFSFLTIVFNFLNEVEVNNFQMKQ